MVRHAELFQLRVDGPIEPNRVFVASEAGRDAGETHDLDRLLPYDPGLDRAGKGAEAVPLGERVVAPVHGAVGEIVVARNKRRDVPGAAGQAVQLQCQGLGELELAGRQVKLAYPCKRAAGQSLMPEPASELEGLISPQK